MDAELYTIHLPEGSIVSFMPHPRGYDWLPGELASYQERGVGMVVSLLTLAELWTSGLVEEGAACHEAGLCFVAFPISDHGVPPFTAETFAIINELAQEARTGTHLAIHCWAGIGRSALITACVLVALGMDVQTVLREISRVRGYDVPETEEQVQWVLRFAHQHSRSR
jgi:protein-tyrosine phosphatase